MPASDVGHIAIILRDKLGRCMQKNNAGACPPSTRSDVASAGGKAQCATHEAINSFIAD